MPPYKDLDKQREAVKLAARRYRERDRELEKKREALMTEWFKVFGESIEAMVALKVEPDKKSVDNALDVYRRLAQLTAMLQEIDKVKGKQVKINVDVTGDNKE